MHDVNKARTTVEATFFSPHLQEDKQKYARVSY